MCSGRLSASLDKAMNPTWQAAFKEQGQARIRIAELEAG